MYPDTSAATHFMKKALQELIYKTSCSRMTNEDDILDYYHLFLELSNPLTEVCQLSDDDRDAKFFKGFHQCYDPPQFFLSLSDPLLVTLSKPPLMAK